jgi:uncharacterized protein YndB with AHSA1/START domain
VEERDSPETAAVDRRLVIERVFDAPRALVFRAWTERGHLIRWWGPRGFTAPFCEMDVRPGGAYRACIRSAEGKDYWMQGVYREIAAPERLVFTFAWDDEPDRETLVTVTFAEQDGKTKLTFEQATFATVADRDSHRDGWAEAFDDLAAYLAETARA